MHTRTMQPAQPPLIAVLPGHSSYCMFQDLNAHVQDFFQKDCWKHHPKPHQEYMDWRFKEDEGLEQYRNRGIPGL